MWFFAFLGFSVPVYIFIWISLLEAALPPNVCIVLLSSFGLIIFHFLDFFILDNNVQSPFNSTVCFLKKICILNRLLFTYSIDHDKVWRGCRVPGKEKHHNIYALNSHIHVHISLFFFWKTQNAYAIMAPKVAITYAEKIYAVPGCEQDF